MPLAEIQRFLTRYLRDATFRERYRNSENQALEEELGLSPDDTRLVRAIDLDDLDRTATGFREDRFSKRETEFQPFLNHLRVFVPTSVFAEEYDHAYRDGTMAQPSEMRNFLDFATSFILAGGLPDYLLELLRFCFHFCQVAVSPRVEKEGVIDPSAALRPAHRITLREPYRLLTFRYDVLALALNDPWPGFAELPPHPTVLLLQKDWELAKRTQVYYAEAVPLLGQLLEGEQLVLDLLAPYLGVAYPALVEVIGDLRRRGVVHVTA